MAYIGASPPATALTASDIADGIISEAKMANDAISLAELKAGTDGEIIVGTQVLIQLLLQLEQADIF